MSYFSKLRTAIVELFKKEPVVKVNDPSNIIRGHLMSRDGCFFGIDKYNNVVDGHTCRESFHNRWRQREGYSNYKYIGFVYKFSRIRRLRKFFKLIEDKLDLEIRTEFIKSNHSSAILIKPSPFWAENETRMSLVTLFIRCGAVHFKGHFEKALKDYHLIGNTNVYRAIDWFLNGNVHPTYESLWAHGFCAHYSSFARTQKQIERNLSKDKPSKLKNLEQFYDLV